MLLLILGLILPCMISHTSFLVHDVHTLKARICPFVPKRILLVNAMLMEDVLEIDSTSEVLCLGATQI